MAAPGGDRPLWIPTQPIKRPTRPPETLRTHLCRSCAVRGHGAAPLATPSPSWEVPRASLAGIRRPGAADSSIARTSYPQEQVNPCPGENRGGKQLGQAPSLARSRTRFQEPGERLAAPRGEGAPILGSWLSCLLMGAWRAFQNVTESCALLCVQHGKIEYSRRVERVCFDVGWLALSMGQELCLECVLKRLLDAALCA
jgi:hypothetical protein